jgi:hypothetical protein
MIAKRAIHRVLVDKDLSDSSNEVESEYSLWEKFSRMNFQHAE